MSIEKGERQTAVDVSIVIEYGASIVEVADNIRESVIRAVEYATGLQVVSVDVNVTDVHLPDEEGDDTVAPRSSDQLSEPRPVRLRPDQAWSSSPRSPFGRLGSTER